MTTTPANFVELFGAPTRAAWDRVTVLFSIAAIGREVPEDAIIAAMAAKRPPWTWEAVVQCCADLADGGALERIRNERGDVIGWRITPAAAVHLVTSIRCGCTAAEAATAPSWLLAMMPSAPRSTSSSMTVMKAVES